MPPNAQTTLFPPARRAADRTSATFADNLSLPVHRWFRFPAGFSANWVDERLQAAKRPLTVLDPFAGSGTVLVEAKAAGVRSWGIEAHPFIYRIAAAKMLWDVAPGDLMEYGRRILDTAAQLERTALTDYPSLIHKCYPPDVLAGLDRLKRAWDLEPAEPSCRELGFLALASILRECSPVGTASWQYVLPNKSKKRVLEPRDAFEKRIATFCEDLRTLPPLEEQGEATVLHSDARTCKGIPSETVDLVVTSPPYANNFDYADSTRLEMSFFQLVEGWADLKDVRAGLVRSCSQHSSGKASAITLALSDTHVDAIRPELTAVVSELSEVKLTKGGRKTYDSMIAHYFADLGRTFAALRRVCRPGASIALVIGDSAPYGVYVPVERWLGELAVSHGFNSFEFTKLRERNNKWKNRKHNVPLHEGILWIKG